MYKRFISIFHPDEFQGWGKSHQYFEGWYFKILTSDTSKAYAIIPGIAMDSDGEKHAFIQVLDGKNHKASYLKFDAEDFIPRFGKFEISIGNNFFSGDAMQLDLPEIKGELLFKNTTPWPSHLYSPGIMGPFSFVPFMECYHGILSLDHQIQGELEIHGKKVNFENGRGYLEKDWGSSFPSAYFWMQSNHFSQKGISVKISVAKIPWLGKSFVGFIGGLWLSDRLIQFTTYNGTKLIKSYANKDKVEIVFQNSAYRLEVFAHREMATLLASPIHGFMEGRIEESMNSSIKIKLIDNKTKQVIFSDVGHHAGLEVAGDIEHIFV